VESGYRTRVFVSFDFEQDHNLKGSLVAQAKDPASPFRIADFSLAESQPDSEWLSRARSAIARCDIFVVILGLNTHQSPGVLKEVEIAKNLGKRRFQLKSQGTNPTPVKNAGPVINWTWNKLKTALRPS
jgi:hypothetical protein